MAKRVVEVFYELRDLFTGKIKKITSGYDDLRKTSGRTADKIERDNKRSAGSFNKLTGSVGKLRSAWFALSGLFAGGAAARGLTNFADELDRLGKVARRLDIDPNTLASLEFAADRSGVSIQKMSAAIETLQKRTGEALQGIGRAKLAFDALGISAEEFANLDAEQQLVTLANALQASRTDPARQGIPDSHGRGYRRGGKLQRCVDEFRHKA